MTRSFAPQAWVYWLITISAITLVTRNPFYLLLLLLVARIVHLICAISGGGVKLKFWRLAGIVLIGSILFNLLMVRIGQTVLFSLPGNWWLIGGSLTLEAAVYGAISGLTLVTLLAIFLAFNSAVPISDLIRLTPRAMANIGLIILLAVTYVPETISHLQRIREAQAIRGHRLRGFRDWQPIVIPLLVGGLERSMSLAESMVSRGYGSTENVRQPARIQFFLLIGLSLTFFGWLLTFRSNFFGWVILSVGIGLVLGLIYWSSRMVSYSRYRPVPWGYKDWLLMAITTIPLILVFLPVPFIDNSTMFYTPYLRVTLPPFDILIGLGLALLVAPAILVEL